MAADNHASYAKIGLAVVLGTFAVLGTLVYIAGIGDHSNELLIETYFNDPVNGLSVGSSVNVRGVQVGEVREISFVLARYNGMADERDAQRVWVLMAIDLRKFESRDPEEIEKLIRERVRNGLRATVALNGVTGLSRIELGNPSVPVPAERLSWQPRHALVPPAPSLMSSLSDALLRAADRFNKMDLETFWSNVTTVAESAARVANGAERLIETQRGSIGSIVRNVDDASQSARDLSERLRDNPSLLLRASDPAPLPETAR